MKNNQKVNVILIIAGILLIILGGFGINLYNENIAGLCIGLGAALASLNVSFIVGNRMYSKQPPKLKRQREIEASDERFIAIRNKAKAEAYDKLIYIMVAVPFVMIIFSLPLWMILAVIAFYVFGYGLQLYYIMRYNKIM